jgi:transketolase
MQRRELPKGWDRNLPVFPADPKGLAGREASGKILNLLEQNIPWLIGGSADLGPSNKTTLTFERAGHFQASNPGGRNMHFGIREHAMSAIVNGLPKSCYAEGLRHPRKICAAKRSVPSAGNQSKMTPGQHPNRQL